MINNNKLIIFCFVCIFLVSCQPARKTEISTISPTVTSQLLFTPSIVPPTTSPPEGTETVAPTKEVVTGVTATHAPEVQEGDIEGVREDIEASDGLHLVGTYYTSVDLTPPFPGVVLLHMLGKGRSSWDEYARLLAAEGYAVFALDMRGHGDTGGEVNWDLAESDISQVWNHLSTKPDVDPNRVAIVGASIGANLALLTGTNEEGVNTVVLLSPGLDYSGVKIEQAMAAYTNRPVLIVASQEDTYSADSSQILEESAAGEVSLVMYQNAGHGTNMFAAEPGLGELIFDWLRTYLK
jgi:dienelactone hydrolase